MGQSCAAKDTAGPILVTVLGMVAEMERKFIRKRQQAGIEAAKTNGV
jgi:DNA invertase Pin-like site-specific DNA recombinase